jgi:hypothetical protein
VIQREDWTHPFMGSDEEMEQRFAAATALFDKN